MPAQRKTNQSRGLTAAGLIAVTAATLLMMAWVIFPTPALADQQISVNPGSLTNHECNADEWHFLINQIDIAANAPATIHVTWANGNSADLTLDKFTGGVAHYLSTANLDSTVTSATATIYDGWNGLFNLSHGPCGTPTPGSITVVKQTNPDGSAQKFEFDTDYGSNFSLADGEQNDSGNLVPGTYSVAEVNIPAGWSLTSATCSDQSNPNSINLAAGEHVTCTFTNTQEETPPGGGGGGGGGGTTTTPPPAPTTTPIVAPTTVTNTSTTATDEVLPTTVRPGKLAFTGIEDVVPIGALALTLMTTGSGLLWAGSRRRRHDGSEDED